VRACLPVPAGHPHVDAEVFLDRFDAAAPAHLRLALTAATILFGGVLPRLMGHWGAIDSLTAEAADAVLHRAERLPAVGPLMEVVKLVACFSHFDADEVQVHVRGSA
jgi:hypothetical protein